jgi:hypothetical protein
MNIARIAEVRISHHAEEVNQLLRDGWVLIAPPFIGLRRVIQDGQVVDIPYREWVLGSRKDDKNV